MGTDYFASRYDVISEEIIALVCPSELTAFKNKATELANIEGEDAQTLIDDLFKVRSNYRDEYDYERTTDLIPFMGTVCSAFEDRTRLELAGGYVGEGLRGSDLHEESFWYIENAQVPNPAVKQLAKKIAKRGYTHNLIHFAWFLDAG